MCRVKGFGFKENCVPKLPEGTMNVLAVLADRAPVLPAGLLKK